MEVELQTSQAQKWRRLYRDRRFGILLVILCALLAGSPPHVLTYYSFVTLTTVGYGDISPLSPATRTLAWIEAITGQFYLAVIVAGLVSTLAGRIHRRQEDDGKE